MDTNEIKRENKSADIWLRIEPSRKQRWMRESKQLDMSLSELIFKAVEEKLDVVRAKS